jgi:hypothetical protein
MAAVVAGVSVDPMTGDGVSVPVEVPGDVPVSAFRVDRVTEGLIVCTGMPSSVPPGDGEDASGGAALGDGLPVMVVAPTEVPVRDAGISSKLNTPITHASTLMIRRELAIHRPIGTTVSPLA